MGTSYVTVLAGHPGGADRRTGIWVNDSILQLLLRLLALHLPEPWPGSEGKDSRTIRDQWLLASAIPFTGCVRHDLETIGTAPAGLSLTRSALTSLISALDGRPPMLPGQLFSLLGMGDAGSVDIRTEDLISTAVEIQTLLDDDQAS
ncbi:hypothetical protein [Paracoccus sp. PAMC 22219]|uniref:hypothetical protein n=1 Tax=Paracoccus sp. PAMC 22219 TaxID=1569209 RepID=UPI0005A8E4C2|nr:hypothetical protein [Paracoccus sp. PAMC 22219]